MFTQEMHLFNKPAKVKDNGLNKNYHWESSHGVSSLHCKHCEIEVKAINNGPECAHLACVSVAYLLFRDIRKELHK